MAKGNKSSSESNVSDVDPLTYEELDILAQNQQVAIDELIRKNKSLKKKLASSSTNYQELDAKFEIVLNDNDELTRRIEALELKATMEASTSSFDNNLKKDASTSCIDLIFETHLPLCKSWFESVTIDELALENEKLKQEVDQLKKDLATMKEQAQPSQDNRPTVVKKLEEGQTVVYFICHEEGHKSYMCKNRKLSEGEEKKKKWGEAMRRRKVTSKANPIKRPTLEMDKAKSTPYLLNKEKDQVVAHKITKGGNGIDQPIWVSKETIHTMKSSKKVWSSKAT